MRITAKADYAVRAAAELAAAEPGVPVKGEALARAQAMPLNFLENILRELRRAGIVRTQRGQDGGYLLARDPASVSIADIIRAVEGPLAEVQGLRPDQLRYVGNAATLGEVWVALRAAIRSVLEQVSIADVAAGDLPDDIRRLVADPEAWAVR